MVTWRLDEGLLELAAKEKDIVLECLRHFHGDRYTLYAYAVMDDHIHVVVRPLADHVLGRLLHTWKSYTAHSINGLRGRSGSLWQKDSYTRVIRGEEDLYEKVMYVLNNPLKEFGYTTDYKWYGWNWD
jgi:type I restriction enzyme R subunit/putative DNA methylase